MQKKFICLSALLIAGLLASCGGEKKQEEETVQPEKDPVCSYSYDATTTLVKWTAYKYTEKAAVSGSFDTVVVEGVAAADNMADVLKNATFRIKTASVQTGDLEKNGNIAMALFGAMANTSEITGAVKSMDLEKNTCVISVKMNDVEADVNGTLKTEGEKISLEAVISLDNWNGSAAIASLNAKCKKNHTGADGKLLVWPEVNLYIETTLQKSCE